MKYGSWSQYGECSVTCGEGLQTRFRMLQSSTDSHKDFDSKLCDNGECPSKCEHGFYIFCFFLVHGIHQNGNTQCGVVTHKLLHRLG